ncbi:MAG: type II toxin-antitoxin system PemK/MazF family toxin [Acidimicrobiia bacterium]|nr:type II toxin-antitoxin system PemK/MazF family toxin [Acidimicrobiia bacterium]MYB23911.1 type II toxin-antitoxin system PemK/MazF family toxin [Acidimicrobiia bacterium]MYJ13466.1 type II toxin-antitoxin system PemK/MazF family toxin [Acidimicrobiia bacterium]
MQISTLTSGDVVDADLGIPAGREAGFRRPAVLVTAQGLLDGEPTVVHVAPITSAVRHLGTEVRVEADAFNGLERRSAVQCQHVRSIATARLAGRRGHIGPVALRQIREVLGRILDIPE